MINDRRLKKSIINILLISLFRIIIKLKIFPFSKKKIMIFSIIRIVSIIRIISIIRIVLIIRIVFIIIWLTKKIIKLLKNLRRLSNIDY